MSLLRRLYAMAVIVNARRYVLPMLAGMVLAVLWEASHPGKPLRYDAITAPERIAVRGDRLEIFVHGSRRGRVCPEISYRYLERSVSGPNGESVSLVVPLRDPAPPIDYIGAHDFIMSLDIPGNIDPGEWQYQVMWIRSCGLFRWGDPTVTVSQPVAIPVGNPSASDRPPIVISPAPLTIVPSK